MTARDGEGPVTDAGYLQGTCPWGDACGGCDLDDVPQNERVERLRTRVAQVLGLEAPPAWVDSPRPTAHRARIKLAIDGGRVGYHAARSHDLVEFGTCRIARPEIQAQLPRLRAWVAAHGEPFEGVELRSDGSRVVFAFVSARPMPADTRAAFAELGDVALDGRPVHGHPVLELEVGGVALRASPASFYQVNLEVNALLVAHAHAALAGCERVLDLYAGIGNFSVPLPIPAVAVEAEGPSGDDLRHNCATTGGRTKAILCRVEDFDPTREVYDAVIADPPRAGAAAVLPRVIRQRPRRIVLVSCHLTSAARDVRALQGYRLASVTCFDLFPATSHVEVVAVLERV